MKFNAINDEKGSIILIVALSLTFIMGFAALVLDYGSVVIEKTKFQNAVDATALSAANYLPSTSLATTKANDYIALNGYAPSDISITFLNSNSTIKVAGTKKVQYGFARILGFIDATITPVAAATKEGGLGPAFTYALFSGSPTTDLALNGTSFNISGSVHSNKNFIMNCSSATITGACEASSAISINGTYINVNNRVPNSPNITMIDFSDTVKTQAQTAGTVYNSDQTFSSSTVNFNNSIYVKGAVSINTSSFYGQGCLLATGNISLNGTSLNTSMNDAVCLYSQTGNITINGSTVTIDGILYAPNGNISINASTVNIHGRVIAKTLSINASTINITSSTNELSSLPSSSVRLVNN